jgi:hypothetical protein
MHTDSLDSKSMISIVQPGSFTLAVELNSNARELGLGCYDGYLAKQKLVEVFSLI